MAKLLVGALIGLAGILLIVSFQKSFLKSQPLASPTPTITPVESSDVSSSDGKMKLLMEVQRHGNGSATYSFFVANSSGEEKRPLFTTTTTMGALSLPHNSWSPDKKLVFIREDGSEEFTFLVFKASGEPFQNSQYLDVSEFFAKKLPKYVLRDATGWASETLLIITTMTADRSKPGPSFWFDIPSRTFLQLRR